MEAYQIFYVLYVAHLAGLVWIIHIYLKKVNED